MARPQLNVDHLCRVGQLAVYRAMWAALREVSQPTIAARSATEKPDPADITKGIDTAAETAIENTLYHFLGPDFDRGFVIVSEERTPNFVPRPGLRPAEDEDTQLIVFVDPVDFTAAAARGLDGSILLSLYHRQDGMLACVVGDIYRRRIYSAARGNRPYYQEVVFDKDPRLVVGLGSQRHLSEDAHFSHGVVQLHTSGKKRAEDLALNVFISKRARLLGAVDQVRTFWESPGVVAEIYTVGGSLGPVRVADGTWDASIEFVKGFRVWDFAPGAFVASLAGAGVIDYDTGEPFGFDFGLSDAELTSAKLSLSECLASSARLDATRRRFVVAATPELAAELRGLLLDAQSTSGRT